MLHETAIEFQAYLTDRNHCSGINSNYLCEIN